MSKQYRRLIVLCEDRQQEVFVRAYLTSLGFRYDQLEFKTNPKGKGSGEQFVREEYLKEVKAYRCKRHRLSIGLIALIDADPAYSVEERIRQFDTVLENSDQKKRQDDESIAIIVPKRNIETWIHYLQGKAVNEDDEYAKFDKREAMCKDSVKKLAQQICPIGLPENAPQSMQQACDELRRVLPG